MKPWNHYPVRTCTTMHSCKLCGGRISLGQRYYDGGYSRRAHVDCALADEPTPKPAAKQRPRDDSTSTPTPSPWQHETTGGLPANAFDWGSSAGTPEPAAPDSAPSDSGYSGGGGDFGGGGASGDY